MKNCCDAYVGLLSMMGYNVFIRNESLTKFQRKFTHKNTSKYKFCPVLIFKES